MGNLKNSISGFTAGQWRLFALVLVIGVFFTVYQILQNKQLHATAALYIGLPLIFALAISLTPKAKTTVGATFKGMTIALLLSAIIMLEGFLCIVIASPILYSIAALVAVMVDQLRKKFSNRNKVQFSAVITLLFFASLEGTPYEIYSFSNEYQISYTEVVDKSPESIREKLSNPAFSSTSRPLFLRLFPFPANVSGQGLQTGAEHKVDFIYKKWIVTNEHKGSTVFRVVEATDNLVRFDIPHDNSYLSHYMTWNSSSVSLEPIGVNKTKVKWTLDFTRDLDPAWYFGPLQTYVAWLAAKVLVKNAAS